MVTVQDRIDVAKGRIALAKSQGAANEALAKYNPNQPRGTHTGQWTAGGGSGGFGPSGKEIGGPSKLVAARERANSELLDAMDHLDTVQTAHARGQATNGDLVAARQRHTAAREGMKNAPSLEAAHADAIAHENKAIAAHRKAIADHQEGKITTEERNAIRDRQHAATASADAVGAHIFSNRDH